jgi:hypothetical protein
VLASLYRRRKTLYTTCAKRNDISVIWQATGNNIFGRVSASFKPFHLIQNFYTWAFTIQRSQNSPASRHGQPARSGDDARRGPPAGGLDARGKDDPYHQQLCLPLAHRPDPSRLLLRFSPWSGERLTSRRQACRQACCRAKGGDPLHRNPSRAPSDRPAEHPPAAGHQVPVLNSRLSPKPSPVPSPVADAAAPSPVLQQTNSLATGPRRHPRPPPVPPCTMLPGERRGSQGMARAGSAPPTPQTPSARPRAGSTLEPSLTHLHTDFPSFILYLSTRIGSFTHRCVFQPENIRTCPERQGLATAWAIATPAAADQGRPPVHGAAAGLPRAQRVGSPRAWAPHPCLSRAPARPPPANHTTPRVRQARQQAPAAPAAGVSGPGPPPQSRPASAVRGPSLLSRRVRRPTLPNVLLPRAGPRLVSPLPPPCQPWLYGGVGYQDQVASGVEKTNALLMDKVCGVPALAGFGMAQGQGVARQAGGVAHLPNAHPPSAGPIFNMVELERLLRKLRSP